MKVEYEEFSDNKHQCKHVNSRSSSFVNENDDGKFVCNLILDDGMCLDKKLK